MNLSMTLDMEMATPKFEAMLQSEINRSAGRSEMHSGTTLIRSGKGHMAAMERLLAAGSPVEPSADELNCEKVAVKMVHREMKEADEANLLEAEDMHVFEREPLADRLPLVSCNSCKKPIKESQYAAHAERCSGTATFGDDWMAENDGGANHKKPPRKARKKLIVAQDNPAAAGERERFQSCDTDDAAGLDSMRASGAGAMSVSEGLTENSARAGRAPNSSFSISPDESTSTDNGTGPLMGFSSTVQADGLVPPPKQVKLLRCSDLDVMCGVYAEDGVPCRRRLTCQVHCESSKRAVPGRRRPYDVLLQELKASLNRLRSSKVHDSGSDPLPMTTKVYYLRHQHRMRTVLGSLFRESCARDSSENSIPRSGCTGRGGAETTTPLSWEHCAAGVPQQNGTPTGFSDKVQMQYSLLASDGGSPSIIDSNRALMGGSPSMPGNQSQLESKFPNTNNFGPGGQYGFANARNVSSFMGLNAGGDFSVCLP